MKYIFILLTASSLMFGCSGKSPKDLGIQEEGEVLKQCPDSPNCVVSFYKENDSKHYIEPIETEHSTELAYSNMKSLLEKRSRTKILIAEKDSKYIRAEVTTPILGFVDDVEFYFGEEGKIHMRSASRVGHSDMGVNRDRLEEIRFSYQQRDY